MPISVGQQAVDFEVRDINGAPHSLRALRGHDVLLSFYRDAACPFCNLRVYELTKAYPALRARGLVMLGFFQSSPVLIRRHVGKHPRPFPLIADPDNLIYRRYAVESSALGLARGLLLHFPRLLRAMLGHGLFPRTINTTLPADFLVGPDGTVRLAYYGRDASDHVPLARVLAALDAQPRPLPASA